MHIPKNDMVKFFIKETLLHQKIRSQKEFAEVINKKLSMSDYVVSGKRIRSLAIEIPGVKMRVNTRKGKQPEENCPVCNNDIRKVYTQNLIGEKLLLRIQCEKCGYVGKNDRWAPKKYEFEYSRFY